MNTLIKVSAAPHLGNWHAINWKQQYRTVRQLQTRIVKATQGKQWRRVKSLQRLLTRSFAAKTLAVRRVTENTGRKTPEIDGKTWSTPADKWNAVISLKRTGYKPQPLKRVPDSAVRIKISHSRMPRLLSLFILLSCSYNARGGRCSHRPVTTLSASLSVKLTRC